MTASTIPPRQPHQQKVEPIVVKAAVTPDERAQVFLAAEIKKYVIERQRQEKRADNAKHARQVEVEAEARSQVAYFDAIVKRIDAARTMVFGESKPVAVTQPVQGQQQKGR